MDLVKSQGAAKICQEQAVLLLIREHEKSVAKDFSKHRDEDNGIIPTKKGGLKRLVHD